MTTAGRLRPGLPGVAATAVGDSPEISADASMQRAARVVRLIATFGASLSAELAARVSDRELVNNVPFLLLFELQAKGPQRPVEIQELTGLTSGGVTKLLDRLEERGVIRRRDGHPRGDRRGVLVEVTPAGREVVAQLTAGVDEHLGQIRAFAAELADMTTG